MKKILSTTRKHIRRAPYQALAAIAVLTLTFFLAASYFLVMAGSEQILRYFETRPQVTVYFTDETNEEKIKDLQQRLLQDSQISQVNYISKDQAYKIYQEQNKNDPLLLEMVSADILPASLEISAKSVNSLPKIANKISSEQGVEEIVFQEDVIEALTTWTNAVRISGIALLVLLSFTSLLIILIIIGLKVAARKTEIGILRLVGATTWYIIGPFILEGIFYGIVGAFFAWGTTYILILYSTPFLVTFLGEIPLLPVPIIFMVALLAGMLSLGTIIGSLASLMAVRRFLR